MNCVENEVIPSQIVSILKDTDSFRNIIDYEKKSVENFGRKCAPTR